MFSRFIPSKDLYNIYKEFYGEERIQVDIIEECTTLLFLAWLGEKIAGAKLFKEYAKKSPFLEEKLQNYFLGNFHHPFCLIHNFCFSIIEIAGEKLCFLFGDDAGFRFSR